MGNSGDHRGFWEMVYNQGVMSYVGDRPSSSWLIQRREGKYDLQDLKHHAELWRPSYSCLGRRCHMSKMCHIRIKPFGFLLVVHWARLHVIQIVHFIWIPSVTHLIIIFQPNHLFICICFVWLTRNLLMHCRQPGLKLQGVWRETGMNWKSVSHHYSAQRSKVCSRR